MFRSAIQSVTRFIRYHWPVAPALTLYTCFVWQLRFIQDDAYITYRYVANYLNGDGLVFNLGERIEGFTNFGWTVLLTLTGGLGLDYIPVSQILGFLFGIGVIVVVWLLARRVLGENIWFAAATVLLLGINQSFAYWTQAGLETAAFTFFATLSLFWFVKRSWLLIFSLTLAVWMRPEGALIAAILIAIEFLQKRQTPWFTLSAAIIAFIFSLPMLGFKLAYYGDWLPNPFYAKTSFTFTQLSDGLEYAGRYLRDYALYGAIFLLPLVFYRRLTQAQRAVWWFAVLYVAYIIFIGGDVLRVHRFFLPVFGPAAILTALSVKLIVSPFSSQLKIPIVSVLVAGAAVLTVLLPYDYVRLYYTRETNFVARMQFLAHEMQQSDSHRFSVALPTIGAFGYELIGHDIIDMVGLTDSTIARHPGDSIPGMATTWKERSYNPKYLLQRNPDYIIFSTGDKPSAPAEKALMLYRQFIDSYRSLGWYYEHPDGEGWTIATAFKRVHPITGELVASYPLEYVDEYKLGLEAFSRNEQTAAQAHFARALAVSSEPHYIYIDYMRARSMLMSNNIRQAEVILDSVIARDSMVFEAHKDLYRIARFSHNETKATIHARWLRELVPWDFYRLQRMADQVMR